MVDYDTWNAHWRREQIITLAATLAGPHIAKLEHAEQHHRGLTTLLRTWAVIVLVSGEKGREVRQRLADVGPLLLVHAQSNLRQRPLMHFPKLIKSAAGHRTSAAVY